MVPLTFISLAWDPMVQTISARLSGAYLSNFFETEVTIGGLRISPLLDIDLEEVFIQDLHDDTLLYSKSMILEMGLPSIKKHIVRVKSINLNNAYLNLVKYEGDTLMNLNFITRHFQTNTTTLEDSIDYNSWEVKFQGLDFSRVKFRLDDHNKPYKEEGMDYAHLEITLDKLKVHDVEILQDSIWFTIDELICFEKSGIQVHSLKGNFNVSSVQLKVDNLLLKTSNSDLDLDFSFVYDDWMAYKNFVNDIEIFGDIRPSLLNLKDIGYFAPSMSVMNDPVRIGGKVRGKVSNLKASKFRFAFGKYTHFNGSITMNGLPDVENTFTHLRAEEMKVSTKDIESFLIPGKISRLDVPDIFETLGIIDIKGSFTGFYNDFVAYASFSSSIGKVTTDLIVKQDPVVSVHYDGKITAEQFDIGKFLNVEDYMGKMNLTALVDGHGLDSETILVRLNGMVNSMTLLGNNFNQIEIKGDFAEKKFSGSMNILDEFIRMKFDGSINFAPSVPIFDFYADINNARLYDLHLSSRAADMDLSTRLRCNFIGNKLDEIEGKIYIDSTKFIENDREFSMDHLALVMVRDRGLTKRIFMHSDFLDASVKGDFLFSEIGDAIMKLTDKYINTDLIGLNVENTVSDQQFVEFEFNFFNTAQLSELFLPDLLVKEGTEIKGSYFGVDASLNLILNSPEMKYQGLKFKSIGLSANTYPRYFGINLSSQQVIFQESVRGDSMLFGLDSLVLNTNLRHDSALYEIKWNDRSLADKNIGNVSGYVAMIDTGYRIARITQADVIVNDSSWTVNPDNVVTFDANTIHFKDLEFIGKHQLFGVNGRLSDNISDTLNLNFKSWYISNFDMIINRKGLDFDGIINGNLKLSNLYDVPAFISDLKIKRLFMNKVLLGDALLKSKWDPALGKAMLDAEIIYHGNVGESVVVDLDGFYIPGNNENNFDIDLKLNNFKIKAFQPFIDKTLGDLKGVASGTFELRGTTNDPLFTGSLKLMRTSFRVNYLNTKYEFAHQINFDKAGLNFNDLVVYDTLGNKAICSGEITHEKLKDFRIDLDIQPQNFICLNTNRYQNEQFYGSAIASGSVRIYGEFDDLNIDVDAATNEGTVVSIPLNTRADLMQNDYIIFINTENYADSIENSGRGISVRGLSLDLNLKVNNDAEVLIYLPDQMGNISGRGKGNIQISITPSGRFSIVGDYTINNGTFLFTIQNLIRKRFEILNGGKILFTGDPYNASLSIRALYKVKTSITGLSPTLDEVYAGERINVDCILWLREKLVNPEIKFNLRFPNVKDVIRQDIYALIDTNDQAVMNQQMISLLMLNSFSYTSGGNLGASSFNLIGNQLSNWLSQISRDFDVGINYRPGDELTEDEIQVALSTQLFNDRLVIDGNIGVSSRNNSNTQNASNIVGDVNIEYKLRKDGRVRLKAFNRSNNISSLEDIAPYTQGVGIFYRKEFNKFGDLFIRKNKKKDDEI